MSSSRGSGGAPISRRPYLLRAMHEWMTDSGLTPHLIVDATRSGVEVPAAYVKDGKIVLNISWNATQQLLLKNDWIEFSARFAGVVHVVRAPIGAVLGIYARESGEGMVFSEDDDGPQAPPPAPPPEGNSTPTSSASDSRRARFKVVK
ncbi:MAG: ClpXP protease specificity-enhancing factor [Steroidobacteraceae bacterium]